MKFKINQIATVAIVCVLIIAGVAIVSQKRLLAMRSNGKPDVIVKLFGTVKREDKDVNLPTAGKVNPGEILDWVITSENNGSGPASDYKVIGQIPAGTTFVSGSATAEAGATIVYSIDNSKSFSAEPLIEEKQLDGSIKKVPAPVSMYTQIRYEWNDALAMNNKIAAFYKVRVK